MAKTKLKTPTPLDVQNEAIGFDIGNTIVNSSTKAKQTFPQSFRVIKRLVDERFGNKSYVVSKVNPEQEIRAKVWIKKKGLHEKTGIIQENIFFCRERHEKAPICKSLGITHFIDDRPEVLSHMESVPHRILFRGDEDDFQKFKSKLQGVIRVKNWREIEELLLGVD